MKFATLNPLKGKGYYKMLFPHILNYQIFAKFCRNVLEMSKFLMSKVPKNKVSMNFRGKNTFL